MARIAYYGAGGAPYHHAAILSRAGHDARFVFPQDIVAGALESFDAFVMPGGGYRAMLGQLEPLGSEGCRAIREYVEAGGMYIGSCAGSYDAATVPETFLRMCPAQGELCLLDARVWNDGESTLGVIQSPGVGVLVAENTAPDHPVMAGISPQFRITHYNGPLFTGGQALAKVTGRTAEFTPAEDFLGSGGEDYLVDKGIELGVANIVAGQRGAGRVVLFGSHPEFGTSVAMDEETDTARLLRNAIDWQLAETAGQRRPDRKVLMDADIPPTVHEAGLAALPALVDRIADQCATLAKRTDEPWLADTAAMSTFGRSPRDIWTAALHAIPAFAAEAAAGAATVSPAVLVFRQSEPMDGGFHGVVPLLEQTADLLADAETAWADGWPGTIDDAYDHLTDSPYHLVAGSYLAAIGRAAAAALLVRSVR